MSGRPRKAPEVERDRAVRDGSRPGLEGMGLNMRMRRFQRDEGLE